MRLVCPNCAAQYELDDSAIPDTGRDVQCSNCSSTWFQEHEKPQFNRPQDDGDEDVGPAPGAADLAPPTTDPRVAEILREEAAHETRLRNGTDQADDEGFLDEAASPAAYFTHAEGSSDQREGKQDDPSGRSSAPQEPTEQIEPGYEEAPQEPQKIQPAPHRDAEPTSTALPDIDALNSSLRSAGAPGAARSRGGARAAPPETAQRPRAAGRFGFYFAVFVGLVALAVYALGPQISDAVPQASPYIARFTILVDQGRHALAGGFASLIEVVRNLLAQYL